MKKLSLAYLAVLLLLGIELFAQKLQREFGKDVLADFSLEAPEYDPEAEAIILFDVAEVRFIETYDGGLDVKFVRTTRIKILKESGLKWAEIEIPLYNENSESEETIHDLKAYTYNLVNSVVQITEVNKKNVYEEKINEYWIRKKFAMPAARVGSIIEYRVEVISPRVFSLPDWRFQNRIPTLFSQYIVGITPFYEYTMLLQGASSFYARETVDEYWSKKTFAGIDYHDRLHDFTLKDIPAFKDESYITSVDDFIIKLDFQLSRIRYPTGGSTDFLTTWEALNKEYLKSDEFGLFIKKSQRKANGIFEEELMIDGLENKEKLKTIVGWVKNNFIWDGSSHRFATKTPKDLMREKTGSSAEINLFLTGMLQAAGLDARPVLTSTRNHGRIKVDYPYTRLFNNVLVIVSIDGTYKLTDGTEPLLAYDRIPSRCLNDRGLIIDKKQESWVNLTAAASKPSVNRQTLMLRVNVEEGMLKSEFLDQSTGYIALNHKKWFGEDHDRFTDILEGRGFEDVQVVQTKNHDVPGKPYFIKYTADYPYEFLDDMIILSPFLSLPLSENKLRQKERKYPVDMNYRKQSDYNSTIMIPPNYEVLNSPKDYKVNNELVHIELKTQLMDNIVIVQGSYYFKKAIYPPEDYTQLKQYYAEIIKRFNEKIVLKKSLETSLSE